jgi:hypothetical protein
MILKSIILNANLIETNLEYLIKRFQNDFRFFYIYSYKRGKLTYSLSYYIIYRLIHGYFWR